MKNFFPKVAASVLAVLLTVFLISSCSVEDLTKDLTIYTSNNFLVSPISIQIADAAHLEAVPSDMIVSIEGRDKAKIFSLMGESKIQPMSGIVALAVKTVDMPTAANPLEFTLVLSAPNYVTVRKNYVLTRNAELSSDKIAMLNLADAPEGVSVENTSFASAASGTTQTVAFESPLSGGKDEQTSVKINAGTQTLAADGSVLSGTIQAQLVHHDAHSEASLSGIAEGFNNLMMKSGAITSKAMMNPAGFYSLSMTASGKEVSKFSQPLDVTMDIDPDFYNSVHNRKIQAGDVLDVISRTETDMVWTAETKATVVNVDGELKVKFKQAHLSIWVIGNLTDMNNVYQTQLKINSDFNRPLDACLPRTNYRYKVVNATNENIVYKEGTSLFNNGEVLDNDVRSDNKIDIKFIILDMANRVVYTSPAQNLVNNPSINIIGKLPATNSVVANINVSGFCTSGTGTNVINTELVPNGVNLWYRDMNGPANAPFGGWLQLVTIMDGKGCAKGLMAGGTYDFALPVATGPGQFVLQTFSKELKQPKGLTVPTTGNLVVNVKSPVYGIDQTLTIVNQGNGVYDLTYLKYPLATNICEEIDKKFSVYVIKK
jgi:hypothetical protein